MPTNVRDSTSCWGVGHPRTRPKRLPYRGPWRVTQQLRVAIFQKDRAAQISQCPGSTDPAVRMHCRRGTCGLGSGTGRGRIGSQSRHPDTNSESCRNTAAGVNRTSRVRLLRTGLALAITSRPPLDSDNNLSTQHLNCFTSALSTNPASHNSCICLPPLAPELHSYSTPHCRPTPVSCCS